MEQLIVKTAVIGGGASGLSAAIVCGRRYGGGSTIILEKQRKTGRKLLATGNGRCNITNSRVSPEHYHGDRRIIASVLSGFDADNMKSFMLSLGVLLREESEGRIYPYSNQASTILDAMRNECERLGVRELCEVDISSVKQVKGGYVISAGELTVRADNVIFATGSQASPMLGADGSGYSLLEAMGLSHKPLFPALSPVFTKKPDKSLKGIRAKGSVTLLADGKKLSQTEGEIQFTENGISGICVFELSRAVNEFFALGTADGRRCSSLDITADLMSGLSFTELCDHLNMCRKLYGNMKATELLSGALNRRISAAAAVKCGFADKQCSEVTGQEIKKLAGCIKAFGFTPVKHDAFKSAQVSAGGFGSDVVDHRTLMVKKYRGMYICGELLDVDGDCGGYNLHFAVGSAMLAAASINDFR